MDFATDVWDPLLLSTTGSKTLKRAKSVTAANNAAGTSSGGTSASTSGSTSQLAAAVAGGSGAGSASASAVASTASLSKAQSVGGGALGHAHAHAHAHAHDHDHAHAAASDAATAASHGMASLSITAPAATGGPTGPTGGLANGGTHGGSTSSLAVPVAGSQSHPQPSSQLSTSASSNASSTSASTSALGSSTPSSPVMLPRKPTNMIYRIFHLGDSTPPETADDDDLSGGNSSGGASGSSGAAQKQAAFLWGKSRRHYNSSSDFDSDEDHSDDSGGSNAPSRKPSRKSSISEAMDSMIRRAGSMTARSKPASHQQPQQPPQHQQHPQQQQSNQQSQTGDLNQLHVAHANTSSASSTSTIHAPKLANRQPSKKGIFSMGNSEEESSDYESEHEDASPKKTIRPSLFKDLLNGTRSKKQTSRPASPSISRGNSESNLHHREDAAAASPFSLEIPPPEHNSTPKQESHHNIFKDLLSPRIRKSSFSSSGFASASASGAASATSSHGSLPRLNGTAVRATESGPTSPVLERKNSSMSLQRSGSSEVSLAEKYGKTEDILGRGAYATVKLCCPMNSKQKFAIKEFRKRRKDESQKEYVKKLIAEFCISSTLDHENVVRTVDLIQDAKHQWCVVMEYCAGGDLYCRISNGSLKSYSEMSCYFAQLVHGVQYLHSMGVSHRDLKPENLILDASGRILKITDFGVSQVFRTPFGTVCKKTRGVAGSGPYIAPEEFCSEEYDSEAVDVWSMGIIYFVMAANSIPWRTAVASDQRYKYFLDHRMHYAAFERLQPGPRSLVYKLIEPDPVKRIKVADLLEDEWLKSVSVCTALNCNSVDHVHESHSGKA